MPTRVLLLRHAESADPTVFHGAESDVGLSERGVRQAAALAPVLAASAPQLVVSSGMRRARATAAPLVRLLGQELHVEPDLHERRVGALAGTSNQGKDGVWPDTLRRWVAGDTGFAPPGAESFDQIRDRVLPVWRRLTAQRDGQTLVVVAHGVVIRVLLLSLLPGWGVADWPRLAPIRNAGVSELVGGAAGWQALRLNELPDAVAAC
jgi:broad specificity phosphatase PhoE